MSLCVRRHTLLTLANAVSLRRTVGEVGGRLKETAAQRCPCFDPPIRELERDAHGHKPQVIGPWDVARKGNHREEKKEPTKPRAGRKDPRSTRPRPTGTSGQPPRSQNDDHVKPHFFTYFFGSVLGSVSLSSCEPRVRRDMSGNLCPSGVVHSPQQHNGLQSYDIRNHRTRRTLYRNSCRSVVSLEYILRQGSETKEYK